MNLKKSYKSLFLIVLIFIVGGVGIVLLPVNESMMVRIIFNYMDLFCVILLNVVYKTERVYWITGITYEEALEAGSERRNDMRMSFTRFWILFYRVFNFIGFTSFVSYYFLCGYWYLSSGNLCYLCRTNTL